MNSGAPLRPNWRRCGPRSPDPLSTSRSRPPRRRSRRSRSNSPMDETVETLMIGVRADTQAFAQDTAAMQASLQTSLGTGADRAATLIENGLARAVRSGKLSFDDLEKTALSVLSEIAAQAV